MIYYYKVLDKEENLIDKVSSYNLRYSDNKEIYACLESQAQYVYAGGSIYRIGWLQPEEPEMKGKFPVALMSLISEEEYLKYKEEQEKVKLNEK